MNDVSIVGRLTQDPELRVTPNGIPVTTFTVAVGKAYTNQNGEKETDFIDCVIWRKSAENVANFTRKGSLVSVSGSLQTRMRQIETKKVKVTEVLCNNVRFLESKEKTLERQQGNATKSPQTNGSEKGRFTYEDPFLRTGAPIEVSEDDLPF